MQMDIFMIFMYVSLWDQNDPERFIIHSLFGWILKEK